MLINSKTNCKTAKKQLFLHYGAKNCKTVNGKIKVRKKGYESWETTTIQ